MNLNKKGYMLVEIVISSVLAIILAYYLLNLTYKFKNTNQDIQESYYFMKDKLLVTKNIMSDLEKGTASNIIETVSGDTKSISFTFILKGSEIAEKRSLAITKSNTGTEIQYGKIFNNEFIITDVSYYEKKLESSLIVGELLKNESKDSVTIIIPIKSIYDDNDYSIKLFINKTEIL